MNGKLWHHKPNELRVSSVVVYTALIGDYDTLRVPLELIPDAEYYVVTDNPELVAPAPWIPLISLYKNVDPTRTARHAKLHPHLYFPKHCWSIWIDANVQILQDTKELFRRVYDFTYPEIPIGLFQHPHRSCIYEEAKEILRRGGLDDSKTVAAHVERYRQSSYPEKLGLGETNVLIRQHSDRQIIDFHKAWWYEIEVGSKRDQLSFNYVAFSKKVVPVYLADKGISVRNDPRFFRHTHKYHPK